VCMLRAPTLDACMMLIACICCHHVIEVPTHGIAARSDSA